jgi:hypothetical protein
MRKGKRNSNKILVSKHEGKEHFGENRRIFGECNWNGT